MNPDIFIYFICLLFVCECENKDAAAACESALVIISTSRPLRRLPAQMCTEANTEQTTLTLPQHTQMKSKI